MVGWNGDSFCVALLFNLICLPCFVLIMPSTVSPRSKGHKGTRRGVGTIAVIVGMRASG